MNSNFEIKNSLYENIQSDAIDIDFGKGIILKPPHHTPVINSGVIER